MSSDGWRESLLDSCCLHPCVSLTACVLPCCSYGLAESKLHGEERSYPAILSGCCCYCLLSPIWWYLLTDLRGETRARYQIPGEWCDDCCTSVCCPCCVLTQIDSQLQDPQPGVGGPIRASMK